MLTRTPMRNTIHGTDMKALAFAAAATAALHSAPAQATDIGDMTEAERAAFGEQVRAYLLENPEVLMEAIAILEERQAAAQAQGDVDLVAANADAIFDDGHSWVGGNPDGDVTVVEFLDYRCGYCRRAFPEVKELIQSDGDIRFIVKEFPILGEQSELASRFAISVLNEAGDDAYEQVHDILMTLRGDVTEPTLRQIAAELDLDEEAVMEGMSHPDVDEIIAENRALAQKLRISGTPSFVFGEQMVRGYVPLDAMQQIVAQERESEG